MADAIKTGEGRFSIVLKRFMILLTVLATAFSGARAQYGASFSHYFDLEPSFNPATVGKRPKANVTAAYALDMAGFEHNPRTMFISGDMPFYFIRSYHGVGVQFMNDKIGLFTHQKIALQYAYRHRLAGGTISAGLQAGLLSENFDGSKLDAEDSGDPALATSSVDGNGLDLGFGLYYEHGPWYVGLSSLHLNAPLIELGQVNELQIDPAYYLTGGYNIRLRNPFLTIKSSALMRAVGNVYRADVTGRLVYTNEKKMMYGGVSYSPTHSVTFLLGGSFHGIVVGYSYELYTEALNPGDGSHELFVGFQKDINLVKKGKNKHKSVRIL